MRYSRSEGDEGRDDEGKREIEKRGGGGGEGGRGERGERRTLERRGPYVAHPYRIRIYIHKYIYIFILPSYTGP